ncbi:MAG: hypothetical protein AAGJ84_12040 [Pseudomonadota bacterium]
MFNRSLNFLRDVRGVAAMQFALIITPLAIVYLGTVSAFDAYRSAQQATQTAVTLTDLVTRVIEMDDNRRDAMFITGNALMSRWGEDSNFSMSMTSVVIDPTSVGGDDDDDESEPTLMVAWSEATSSAEIVETADLDNYNLPTISLGESMVLVEIKGKYQAAFNGLGLPAYYTVERTAVRRPRFVNEVPYI